MTDIETKALALVNEVADGFHDVASIYDIHTAKALRSALCRAVEQHEAFRQDVSDALRGWGVVEDGMELSRFIIAKPDPLVEVFKEVDTGNGWDDEHDYADQIRAAIKKRGGKIVWED